MNFWRVVRIGVAVVLGLIIVGDLMVTVVMRDAFYRLYMKRLDGWVDSGGPQNKIHSDVIFTCNKLAVSQAGPVGGVLMLFDRDEYDFQSDVCFQITVNRVVSTAKIARSQAGKSGL